MTKTQVRIVVVSDTHGMHRALNIPACDILIHCGDATNFGAVEEVAAFAGWCNDLKSTSLVKHIVFCPGNHDLGLYEASATDKATHRQTLKKISKVHYLVDSAVTLCGLRIYGSPWTRRAMSKWAFPFESEQKAYDIFKRIPEDVDILVTHGPPKGIMDSGFGSIALMDIVQKRQPTYHLFGHVHEGYGQQTIGSTTFVNGCSLDERKLANHAPMLLLVDRK